MSPSSLIERLWWRRLPRRKRSAAAVRANRLTHFEPLEQRMVLSSSMWMGGGDFWHQPQHDQFHAVPDEFHSNDFSSQGFNSAVEYGKWTDWRTGSESYPLAHDEYHQQLYASRGYGDGSMLSGQPLEEPSGDFYGDSSADTTAEGESSTTTPTLSASSPYGPALADTTEYTVEIVIVADSYHFRDSLDVTPSLSLQVAAPRLTIVAPSVGGGDAGYFTSFAATLAMQRRNEYPPQPESGNPYRSAEPLVALEEASSTISKPTDATLTARNSSSLLPLLADTNSVGGSHVSANADSQFGEPNQLRDQASQSADEDGDGLVEMSASEAANLKRKTTIAGESRAATTSRLERLADLPVVRITESFFRELVVMFDGSAQASRTDQPATTNSQEDDGLIELLAADVVTLAPRNAVSQAASQPKAAALDSGVALYQQLDTATIDDSTSDGGVAETHAAPAVVQDQLVQAE